ncbi:DUF2071 domain-containing protein [Cryobacterium sp. CG_9.6]|uniref:YqjF family protein n=1 Tax=Cryobacterium sp. CG_9.6 TaxID=2760710 RepID=UPI00247712F9|nr:DUF2071 domain-containing protein [Cryobacterium sp. CG_9.6]MDH6236312.1 uncharacterized protein YqjF (DUF2071 family) [Cryobacterium sp. CG_9.6]
MTDSALDPISSVAPPLAGRAVASQRWSNLVFLHWRVDAALVAPLLPAGLVPDEHDGTSWVGLIPFVLDRATVFGSPPIPYFGTFVEVNVRLYAVDSRGHRGVVFVSLEASRLAAVLAARALFAIPYMWSSTRLTISPTPATEADAGSLFHYTSKRHLARAAHSTIVARSTTRRVIDNPLGDFLTARWALFTYTRGRTIHLRNHHEPWELFEAELVSLDDTLLAVAGFPGLIDLAPDSVLYSPGVTTWFGGKG